MANQQNRPGRSTKQDLRATRREQQRLAQQKAAQRKRLMMIIGGVVAVAVIAVVALILVNRDSNSSGSSDLPAVVAAAPVDASIPSNGLTIGDPNAPVTLLEYGDYQCPYCAQFSNEALEPLMNDYIATGKVVFTYVPMSFLGDESIAAAEAAFCANDQGKFWQMHETIYRNHNGENQGAYSRDRLNSMAEQIGLNMDQFNSCMDSGQHKGDVDNAANTAKQAGITSTPSFTLNNGEVFGYGTWESMKGQIDAALGQ